MKILLVLILGVLGFLAAAKGHGRQVRLEREAHGVHQVTFGGENPPLVQKLWRGDRVRFWSAAPLMAVVFCAAIYFSGAAASGGVFAVAAFLWAPVIAFSFCGVASALRLHAFDKAAFASTSTVGFLWLAGAVVFGALSAFVALSAAMSELLKR